MSFLGRMGEIQRAFALYRSSRLEEYGLVGAQSLYLQRICRNPGVSQEKLAAQLIFNKSSVARQLAALEEKGFIKRERSSEDRRILLVHPTEKALEVLPLIRQTFLDFLELISADLSPAERETLEMLTEKIDLRAKEAVKDL